MKDGSREKSRFQDYAARAFAKALREEANVL